MYFYLGQDTVINTDQIIGVFDLDNTTVSKITREYLAKEEKEGKVKTVNNELPKSFVVCYGENVESIYLSQVSPSTLRKRSRQLNDAYS